MFYLDVDSPVENHPTWRIGVDGDRADILLAQLTAPGVHALGACPERDIVFLRSDQCGVEAPVAEVLDYCSRDFTCVFVLPEEKENHFPMQTIMSIDNQ